MLIFLKFVQVRSHSVEINSLQPLLQDLKFNDLQSMYSFILSHTNFVLTLQSNGDDQILSPPTFRSFYIFLHVLTQISFLLELIICIDVFLNENM